VKPVLIDPVDAKNLIKDLDDYQASLYPAESNHLESLNALGNENVVMLGIKEKNAFLAIGAVKIFEDYGEIKRVFVPKVNRGKGLAKMIMAALEKALVEKSVWHAKLETGIHQHEAIGLYRRLGYRECRPFGSYETDPLSVFMSKRLDLTH